MKNKSEHEHRRQNWVSTYDNSSKCVTRKFDVLVLQNSVVNAQNNGKERQKACCKCKFGFFLLIRKKCAARAIVFFAN